MPIITKPTNIEKNVNASFTLDKSALAVVPSVAASSYYSDSSNWSKVLVCYKSNPGTQKEIIVFDATVSSPESNFLVSERARDIFQVQQIIIVDFDNGDFVIPRSQLNVSEFDIDMTPSSSSINWIKANPATLPDYGTNGGFVPTISSWSNGAKTSALTGDYDYTVELQILGTGLYTSDCMFGFTTDPNIDLTSSFPYYSPGMNTVYIDQGTSPSVISGSFTAASYGGFGIGIYNVRFKRIGNISTISFVSTSGSLIYEVTNSVITSPVSIVILLYSPFSRINEASQT